MFTETFEKAPTTLEEERSIFESPQNPFPETKVSGYVIITTDGLEKMVDEKVEEKIRKILEERDILKFKKIDDAEAKMQITSFILGAKKKGVSKINILDIICSLNLPPEQIERIMKKFEKEKSVVKI